MAKISLRINGKNQTVDAEPEMPLLYALRNDLQLNGPKFGCGLAQCGACTVIMDGNAIRSCVTPVSATQNKSITTLEGLGSNQENAQNPAGLRRRAGGAVRLLHQRHDHEHESAAGQESQTHRRPDQRSISGESLPLRHAYSHLESGQTGLGTDGVGKGAQR